MATIQFQPIGKKEIANIYLRLSIDRDNVFRRKTGYTINHNDWSLKKKEPLQNDASLKKLKTDLDELRTIILKAYNEAIAQSFNINSDWLQKQIDKAQGKSRTTDPDRLINHFQSYINYLPYKRDSKKSKPVSAATIKKYTTIKNKIEAFEKYRNKPVFIKEVDLSFRKEFINYLKAEEKLSDNTVGRYITFIKTVCNDAKIYNIETNPQLEAIKGYTVEAKKIFFSPEELKTIEEINFKREALDNARDWLLIGCHIGQRVSDLLTLTSENIVVKSGFRLIQLTQRKTGKRVAIPIDAVVERVLAKRNGSFPRTLSDQKFNNHIKDVAKEAKIDEPTEGAITKSVEIDGEKVQRKEHGVYPKHELVTSHICRRSFATNHYGDMPTSLIISVTGHSTETQFLEYVGKPPIDQALQIAEFWARKAQEEKGEAQMNILKSAQ